MALKSNRGLILAAAGIAALLAATLAAYRTPAPLGSDAPATEFSASRARAVLQELVGSGVPHPIGSPANATVRDLIVKRLAALGYTPTLQSGLVCNDWGTCGTPTNIVATLGGVPAGGDAVLLSAHYDSVPAGPGASDDGAGVAAVLEIARILAAMPAPRHPVVLLLTDGEEGGLLGALLFTREHDLAKHVWAAVNMDSRGTSGPSLMFETGTANAWLMRLYAAAVLRPITNSLCYVVYKTLPNNTDFTVFKEASYQGFNLAFIGDVARYHTPLDSWENSSASTLQHQGNNALSAVLALANSAEVRPPAAESVFFDVFARAVIVWPVKFVLPAALVALGRIAARGGGAVSRRAAEPASGGVGRDRRPQHHSAGRLAQRGVGRAASGPRQTAADGCASLDRASFGDAARIGGACAVGGHARWALVRAPRRILGPVVGRRAADRAAVGGRGRGDPGASFVLLLTAVAAALAPLPAVLAVGSGRESSQGR